LIDADFTSTKLLMKEIMPVRLLKNPFALKLESLEKQNTPSSEIEKFVGKGRAKDGIHDGNIDEGKLEAGQISALIKEEKSVKDVVETLIKEYEEARQQLF
jgi:enoyl-[acyl-carrier protein] reductase II